MLVGFHLKVNSQVSAGNSGQRANQNKRKKNGHKNLAIIVSDHNFVKKYYLLLCPALRYTIFEEGKKSRVVNSRNIIRTPPNFKSTFHVCIYEPNRGNHRS